MNIEATVEKILSFCSKNGWVGVDLDGTLALNSEGDHYNPYTIGKPVQEIVQIVHLLLERGQKVKIFTARIHVKDETTKYKRILMIQDWLVSECRLPRLEVTNVKDTAMRVLLDDRALHVPINSGEVKW